MSKHASRYSMTDYAGAISMKRYKTYEKPGMLGACRRFSVSVARAYRTCNMRNDNRRTTSSNAPKQHNNTLF